LLPRSSPGWPIHHNLFSFNHLRANWVCLYNRPRRRPAGWPGVNWVCLAHSTRRTPGATSGRSGANWVCLARLPRAGALHEPRPENWLCLYNRLPDGRRGLALLPRSSPGWPIHHNLFSFSHLRSNWVCLYNNSRRRPCQLAGGKLALFGAFRPPWAKAPGQNWLCLAESAVPLWVSSQSAIRNPKSEIRKRAIGFVLHNRPSRRKSVPQSAMLSPRTRIRGRSLQSWDWLCFA
jgi:hypothetical protein